MGKENSCIKLTDGNYPRWQHETELFLKQKGVWTIVNGTRTSRDVKNEQGVVTYRDTVFEADSYKALLIISRSLTDEYHNHLIGIDDPKSAWEKINTVVNKSTALNVNNLARQYQQIELSDPIEEYFAQLRQSLQCQKNVDVIISDSNPKSSSIKLPTDREASTDDEELFSMTSSEGEEGEEHRLPSDSNLLKVITEPKKKKERKVYTTNPERIRGLRSATQSEASTSVENEPSAENETADEQVPRATPNASDGEEQTSLTHVSLLTISGGEPMTYNEAIETENSGEWSSSMSSEHQSLMNTVPFVEMPPEVREAKKRRKRSKAVGVTSQRSPTETPVPESQSVGSLIWLASSARSTPANGVSMLSTNLNNPDENHVEAVKRVVKHRIRKKNRDIQLSSPSPKLTVNCESDLGDSENRSSIFDEVNIAPQDFAIIRCINQATESQEYQDAICQRTRNIDESYHHVPQMAREKFIDVKRINTTQQVAVSLTKEVPMQNPDQFLENLDHLPTPQVGGSVEAAPIWRYHRPFVSASVRPL